MNKIIIVFGIFLLVIAGFAYYQFNKNQGVKVTGSAAIGSHTFAIEAVKDEDSQQIGLTKYNSIKDDQGMVFIFEQPGTYGFWMKNMKFPLDILFINNDTIVSFVENAPPVEANEKNPTIYQPESPADHVLEINAGLIKKYEIKKGDKIKIETK